MFMKFADKTVRFFVKNQQKFVTITVEHAPSNSIYVSHVFSPAERIATPQRSRITERYVKCSLLPSPFLLTRSPEGTDGEGKATWAGVLLFLPKWFQSSLRQQTCWSECLRFFGDRCWFSWFESSQFLRERSSSLNCCCFCVTEQHLSHGPVSAPIN